MKPPLLLSWTVSCCVLLACGKSADSGSQGDASTVTGGSDPGASGGQMGAADGGESSSGGLASGGSGGGAAGSGGASSGDGGRGGGGAGGSMGGAGSGGGAGAVDCKDVFGATELYSTAPGGLVWTSEYWSGAAHAVDFGTPDPADPLGLLNRRGTGEVTVNGDGTLSMTGSQPRIYLGTMEEHPWLNVEVTVYYQRLEDDDTDYAGIVVGARSGPDGHSNDYCTASTYYARIRHDGRVDVAKELEHPNAQARAATAVWPNDGPLPHDQWIGMKYVVYNDDMGGVRLRVFRDLTEGADGGAWELLLDSTDDGGWVSPHDCSFEPDHIILEGGGVVFIRNTGTTGPGAQYRNLTIREIEAGTLCSGP